MDKYERLIFAVSIIAALSIVIYFVALITGNVNTKFPFVTFIPSWFVIWIPIISQKRLIEKRK
jgi:hypothetical protein